VVVWGVRGSGVHAKGMARARKFIISNGSIDIVRICDIDETQRIPDRVTWRHIGHIFVGVTRAGEASRRPYEEKFKCADHVNRAI
jgi:hypothetical protein